MGGRLSLMPLLARQIGRCLIRRRCARAVHRPGLLSLCRTITGRLLRIPGRIGDLLLRRSPIALCRVCPRGGCFLRGEPLRGERPLRGLCPLRREPPRRRWHPLRRSRRAFLIFRFCGLWHQGDGGLRQWPNAILRRVRPLRIGVLRLDLRRLPRPGFLCAMRRQIVFLFAVLSGVHLCPSPSRLVFLILRHGQHPFLLMIVLPICFSYHSWTASSNAATSCAARGHMAAVQPGRPCRSPSPWKSLPPVTRKPIRRAVSSSSGIAFPADG